VLRFDCSRKINFRVWRFRLRTFAMRPMGFMFEDYRTTVR